jgi:hypothetical protein
MTEKRPRGRPVGTKLSDETKARIGTSSVGRISATRRAMSINGVIYPCAKFAAAAIGLPTPTIRARCLSDSDKFKDWFFI